MLNVSFYVLYTSLFNYFPKKHFFKCEYIHNQSPITEECTKRVINGYIIIIITRTESTKTNTWGTVHAATSAFQLVHTTTGLNSMAPK